MSCSQYGPFVSLYLDDELEKDELEKFIDHLSGCVACQKEIESLERLRSWLRAADAFHECPAPNIDKAVTELFQKELAEKDAPEIKALINQEATPPHKRRKRSGPHRLSWLNFPSPTFAFQRAWRLALPLLLAVVAGIWFYDKPGDWIDVHELSSSQVLTSALPQKETQEEDLYVIQHTMHQPWVSYGDELPMIQLASGSSR